MTIKKFYPLFIFSLFLIFSSGCIDIKEEELKPLPTFAPIGADSDTIYLTNYDTRRVYAVDSKNSKIVYRYDFDGFTIHDLIHDSSFDINPYIILLDGRSFKLDVRSGRAREFNVKYLPNSLAIVDNKLWINPIGGNEYFTYDPSSDQSKYITLPHYTFTRNHTKIDGKDYIVFFDSIRNDIIYNLTDNVVVGDSLFSTQHKTYVLKSHYLQELNINAEVENHNIYYIKSFEPLDGNYLFSTGRFLLRDVYEKDNFAYFLTIFGYSNLVISKMDMNDGYAHINSINLKDSGNFVTYCRYGYIWVVSENNDGVYKINMDDLSYEVIR